MLSGFLSTTSENRLYGGAALLCGCAFTIATFALLCVEDAVVACVLLWGLTALAAIDIRTYMLPNALTLPLLAVGLLLSAMGLGPSLISGAFGAIVGYGSLFLIALCYRRLRGREGLGLGDAKLLAGLGAWTGIEALPTILLGASLLALVCCGTVRLSKGQLSAHDVVPFGPFLSISGYCAFLNTKLI
jgi:prepilin signal peptidase PulO-like enzyme (type II secretory pathway)